MTRGLRRRLDRGRLGYLSRRNHAGKVHRRGVTITVGEITCHNIKPKVLLVQARCPNHERQSASLAGTFRREDRTPNNSHAKIENTPRSIAANHMAPGISVETY